MHDAAHRRFGWAVVIEYPRARSMLSPQLDRTRPQLLSSQYQHPHSTGKLPGPKRVLEQPQMRGRQLQWCEVRILKDLTRDRWETVIARAQSHRSSAQQ